MSSKSCGYECHPTPLGLEITRIRLLDSTFPSAVDIAHVDVSTEELLIAKDPVEER